MLHDLLAWCLHSPRRLILVGVAGLSTAVLGLTLGPFGTNGASDTQDETLVVERIVPPPSSGSSPVEHEKPPASEETPARWTQVRSTVRSFLAAYLPAENGSSKARINQTVQRWTTPSLWRGLRLTDSDQLPSGRVTSLEEVSTGAFASEANARLNTGRTLRLTLVVWEHGWRVADVRLEDSP